MDNRCRCRTPHVGLKALRISPSSPISPTCLETLDRTSISTFPQTSASHSSCSKLEAHKVAHSSPSSNPIRACRTTTPATVGTMACTTQIIMYTTLMLMKKVTIYWESTQMMITKMMRTKKTLTQMVNHCHHQNKSEILLMRFHPTDLKKSKFRRTIK